MTPLHIIKCSGKQLQNMFKSVWDKVTAWWIQKKLSPDIQENIVTVLLFKFYWWFLHYIHDSILPFLNLLELGSDISSDTDVMVILSRLSYFGNR